MFEEIISAGIVSIIVLMLLITLPGEAPLKRLLSKHAISKLFYYYATFYLTFAVILIFWTICNWGWKSISFQSYTIIEKLEKRITKLLLLIVLVIPCRYILRLMIIPPSMNTHYPSSFNKLETIIESAPNLNKIKPHQRHKSVPLITFQQQQKQKRIKVRDSIDMKDIKKLLFGSTEKSKQDKTNNNKQELRINKQTPFQELERISTLHNASKWNPLPLELFEIARIFQLFAKIRVHGQQNIPTNKPCLIVINHALGHGFDVPMMVYILRKYCNLSHVRVLVSSQHFNYPLWCDMVYYLGGVPRIHQVTEHLMKNGENIIMFAAKKKKTSMIWDDKRKLYLDLVHKYDYVLVPAVCVSDDDVINMVYNIHEPSTNIKNIKQKISDIKEQYDTDTDNEEDESQSFKTIHGRFRTGYRKQYHLRFSKPIAVPKGKIRPRKKRKSTEFKMDDDYSFFVQENESPQTPQTPQSSGKGQVRFSPLEYKNQFEYSVSSESVSDIDTKNNYNDMYRIAANNSQHKRRWSKELEVGLKNAVEDAMTDGISEMYKKLKSDPNSSLLKTIQKKMKSMSPGSEYHPSLQNDIRSTVSNDVPVHGVWVD